MSRRLWIADEVRDWLAALRSSDPSAAAVVGEAVIALMGGGLGPPLVVPVDPARWAADPTVALDYAYQRQLRVLQKVRRATADLATSRKRLELHIAQLEAQVRKLGEQSVAIGEAGRQDIAQEVRERQVDVEDRLAELRREDTGIRREEEDALLAYRRLQHRTEALRIRKEKIKITYAAGRARYSLGQALAEAGETEEAGAARESGRPTAGGPTATSARSGTVAEARTEVEALMDATRRLESDQDATAPELQELRLGAITGRDLRVLFAVEPHGAVLLLAAARGELGDEALRLAYDPASGGGQETEESFLSRFFPGEEAERREGAARLAGRERTQPLEDARTRTGLTVEQVAERMGTTPERVAAVERAADAVEVGVLAAYVEALGGRLEVVADLGTERIGLR